VFEINEIYTVVHKNVLLLFWDQELITTHPVGGVVVLAATLFKKSIWHKASSLQLQMRSG